jgi:hypothetical protein
MLPFRNCGAALEHADPIAPPRPFSSRSDLRCAAAAARQILKIQPIRGGLKAWGGAP